MGVQLQKLQLLCKLFIIMKLRSDFPVIHLVPVIWTDRSTQWISLRST